MKYSIESTEEYPVYKLERGSDTPGVELSQAEFADYERVMREYDQWQERLGAICERSQIEYWLRKYPNSPSLLARLARLTAAT